MRLPCGSRWGSGAIEHTAIRFASKISGCCKVGNTLRFHIVNCLGNFAILKERFCEVGDVINNNIAGVKLKFLDPFREIT